MGITFNGIIAKNDTAYFIRETLLPIIKKNGTVTLQLKSLIESFGLGKLPIGNLDLLISDLNARGILHINNGSDFYNTGAVIDIELDVPGAPDERFYIDAKLTGKMRISNNNLVEIGEIEGFTLGNSDVKWIKFIPERGIYIRRSLSGNDYFIDWQFKPEDEAYHLGIDDSVEAIVEV